MRASRPDGIHAIAVLLVIVARHVMGERTDWMEIDTFVALSGFLITGILVRSDLSLRSILKGTDR